MKLIIGCGNTDRSDDGAGILVARRLRALGLNAVEHSGDGLALIELWHGFDDVVVVDAMVSGAEPGSVTTWDPVSEPICSENWRSSSHSFGPAEAIELARVIGRLPERIRIYGIEGAKFEPGVAPSTEVMEAVDCVGRKIAGEISAG
jgi:hydrogenase maturation protease